MKQEAQQAVLSELVELKQTRQQYLDNHWVRSPVTRYGPERFAAEREQVFLKSPLLALHASELDEPGAFVTRNILGLPLLFCRGTDGEVRCFLNVCRHRGAELVGDSAGCKRKFTCPYHAWTWDTAGNLVGVPHEASGFPGLDRSDHSLVSLPCTEAYGWVWFVADPNSEINLSAWLGDLADDMAGLKADELSVFAKLETTLDANWKFLVEGGLEAYHFKVAHKETIAPLFLDNLSSYQCFGPHIRSVLPRSHLLELEDQSPDDWDVNQYANLLYTLFPGSQFLVQQDHLVWVQIEPVAADKTNLRLLTLVPIDDQDESRSAYWQKNHDFTVATLSEDFALGEGIQRGVNAGANTHFNLGRFEGALDQFNRAIETKLNQANGENS